MRDLTQAIELIKRFEGILDGDPATVNLDPYLCPAGYWTIGWGHVVLGADGRMLKGVGGKGEARAIYPHGITLSEAEALLDKDVSGLAAEMARIVTYPISDNQFCALVSFAYNVGVNAFRRSTLLRVLNEGSLRQVPTQLLRWTQSGGKELGGLKRRREAEVALWNA